MAQQKQKQRQNKNSNMNQGYKNQNGKKGQRPRQGQKKQPNPVTAPLDPAGVRRETRASTQLKFRPLERAIGAEVRASKQRTKQIGNWWQNYLDEVSGVQADTAAAYDQANATTQGLIAQAGATDAAQTSALQAEAAKNAELRGAAPGTELAGREAAAGAQRNYLSAAYGGKNAAEGAHQKTYLADKRRIGVGQSIASRKEEMRRTRATEKDRKETRKERGNYAVEKRGELRDKERDYLIQRRAFPEAKAERRQQERENAQEEARLRRSQSETERHNRATEQASREDGGSEGLTPSQKRDAREGRRGAVAAAGNLIKANGVPKTAKEWAGLQALLEDKEEISPTEARYAIKKLKKRYVGMNATPAGR